MVALGEPDQLVEGARALPDLEAEIPEQIEDRLDHRLGPGIALPRRHEGDVDVRMERHLAAPIAADRHQQQPLRCGRIAERVQLQGDEIISEAKDLVGQEGIGRGGLASGIGPLLEPARDLGSAGRQRVLEDRGRALAIGPLEPGGDRAPVDDLALARDRGEPGAHPPCSASSRFSA